MHLTMKRVVLTLFFFIAFLASDIKAQSESDKSDFNINNRQIQLTIDTFLDQNEMPEFTLYQNIEVMNFTTDTLFDSRFIKPLLYLGDGIIGQKLNNRFHPRSFPRTVTDFNNAMERRMFDAEPTFQERRSFREFWFY